MDAPVVIETFSNPFDMENMCENGRCGKPAGFSDHPFFGKDFPLGSHSWRSGSPGRDFSTTTNSEVPQNHNHEPSETTQESQTSQQQNPEMANNVRIIPIHVEGYDEPVMPSSENISARQAPRNVRHPNKEEKQDVPEKQHQTTQQSQPHPQTRSTPPSQTQPSSETQHPTPPPQKLGPIDQIKSIQTSVLELMGEVERFNGKPKDKQYSYLDEMLTRNLLKLDNVETEGKDTIRQARKEAVKCIQQCLGILEAKAKANKELEDQLLEIDRLVGKISEPETASEQIRPKESNEEKASASMEVDTENLGKTSGDVKTETEKDEGVKETESKKGEAESMDTTSEVSNNLGSTSKEDNNQVPENKEAAKV